MTSPVDVTRLLHEWKDGDRQAAAELLEALMPELRRIAGRCFAGEKLGHTLQPTALVNEAFIRLAKARNIDWRNRGHFLALAARVMRRHLIDHARARPSAEFVTFEGLPERWLGGRDPVEAATALDGLLEELAAKSAQQSAVVELKFFLGLKDTEGAEALGLTLHTFQREWYRARKWLFEKLTN